MKNSTLYKIYGYGTLAVLALLTTTVWPVPDLLNAKDTAAVFIGAVVVIAIALGGTLFVNKLVKNALAQEKK